MEVPSEIEKAYVSAGRLAGTVYVKEVPVSPVPTVLTVTRAVDGPFLRRISTGPVAPDQVRVKV